MKWNIEKKWGYLFFREIWREGRWILSLKGGHSFIAENFTNSSGSPPPIFNEQSLSA